MLNFERLKPLGHFEPINGWSCRESNPGPNIFVISFLHVYSCIACREMAGAEQTNHFLSCMVLSNRHSLRLQHPVFCLSRRINLATGKPAHRP
jgi:hypothetical protein